jgi:phosphoenolpyruvate---glycerone phosphotransferase subunit DhaL
MLTCLESAMTEITPTTILRFLECAAAQITAHREELIQLDSPIGDADHGANLDRGFSAVLARAITTQEAAAPDDIGAIFKHAGMTLVSTVGGSSGPLYGTFFIRAGTTLANKASATPEEFVTALASGVEGIMARGRATAGEKTMLDTLVPFVQALQTGLQSGQPFLAALDQAIQAAESGMRSTIPMLATKGRASYLGERSIGHQDPGATSAYYLVLALREACSE